jgi:protein-tyrosine-phosphatase
VKPAKKPDRPRRLLVVCTGNTCRSPMLAALLRHRLGDQAQIDSAGTAAATGEPASAGAIAAMRRRGLDLASHRSTPLAQRDLAAYDRIWCMTSRHAAHVRSLGVPAGRIAVVAAEDGGVPDPFGGDAADYEACAQVLDRQAAQIAADQGEIS